MKPSPTIIESLNNTRSINTHGDLRQLLSNVILAVARKEIGNADLLAISKGAEAINNSLLAEVKVAKLCMELREKGGNLGKIARLGHLIIGTPDTVESTV